MMLDITVDHLGLRYGNTTALDDLTFHLSGGKIYGLLGRNGSGKTSLLSVLAAFRKASAGTVRIDGEPVFENRHVIRQVCLIREAGDGLDKSESVSDALEFAEYVRRDWDGELASRLVERFKLPTDKKIGALSRGQRSALGITLGMATRAPLTMFDESHLGMDAPSRYVFYDELLADFAEHPRTVIISSHLIDELSGLLEEVVILDAGRLLMREQAETLRSMGAEVTGPAEEVDRFATGRTVLSEKTLGRTKSVMIYESLDDAERDRAREAGLDLGPVALQDLFVHLTEVSK